MGKTIWQSKTFWVNLLATIVAVGAALQGSELIAENPQLVGLIGGVIGVVNIGLRLLTNEPIK